jgi:hypothetical protein
MEKGTITRVIDYYLDNEKYENEINRAKGEFFNFSDGSVISNIETSIIPYFLEWFIFEFKLKNGKKPIEDFYNNNPYNFSDDKLLVYKDLLKNEYGLFEILKIDLGKGMEVINLANDKKYYVNEKKGTHQAHPGCSMFSRISKINNKYEFVACDSIIFNSKFGKNMKKIILKDKKDFSPKNVYKLIL